MPGYLVNKMRLVLHGPAVLFGLSIALIYRQRTYHAVPRIQNQAKGRSHYNSGEPEASYVLFAHGT